MIGELVDIPVETAGVLIIFFNLFILWKCLIHNRKFVVRKVQKIMDEQNIAAKDKKNNNYPS